MLPVRCFTCNNVVGHHLDNYVQARRCQSGKDALDMLGLSRICCRRMILTAVPVVDDIVLYSNTKEVMDECGTVLDREVVGERTIACE